MSKNDEALLALLGEELKQPLFAISQIAELESSEEIKAQAQKALRTIDNVLLHRQIQTGQTQLQLEPVHVGSTMRDVEHTMKPLMRQQGCETELKIRSGLQPADIDRQVFRGLLESLWQAFSGTITTKDKIICRAHKTKSGIRVSMTCKSANLEKVHFAKVNAKSTQPLAAFAGPAADFLTAKELGVLLNTTITKTATSIGVTLPVSRQLQMV